METLLFSSESEITRFLSEAVNYQPNYYYDKFVWVVDGATLTNIIMEGDVKIVFHNEWQGEIIIFGYTMWGFRLTEPHAWYHRKINSEG